MKEDLREYTDNELSLHVFNNEGLYSVRQSPFLKEILEEDYLFTNKQWEVLEEDLEEDGGVE